MTVSTVDHFVDHIHVVSKIYFGTVFAYNIVELHLTKRTTFDQKG